MAAFQPYAGDYRDEGHAVRWSCYATCPVYEVRTFDGELPRPPAGRQWVKKPRNGRDSVQVAVLVDERIGEFSQMLTQINLHTA